jgi:hypothetical protein
MELLNFVAAHWFDTLQTVAIVSGLLYTGSSFRTDIKAKRLQSLFTLTKHHREIWSELYSRPELSRILDPKADIVSKPITNVERLFVNFIILHLNNAYQAGRLGLYKSPDGLKSDITSFFTLPLPNAVWEKTTDFQDRQFYQSIVNALSL